MMGSWWLAEEEEEGEEEESELEDEVSWCRRDGENWKRGTTGGMIIISKIDGCLEAAYSVYGTHLNRRRGFLRSDDLFLRSRVGSSRGSGRLRVAHGVEVRQGR